MTGEKFATHLNRHKKGGTTIPSLLAALQIIFQASAPTSSRVRYWFQSCKHSLQGHANFGDYMHSFAPWSYRMSSYRVAYNPDTHKSIYLFASHVRRSLAD
jgi:hypothetical protein